MASKRQRSLARRTRRKGSRQITQEHLEAGLRLAETYGRYDLAMGCRRTAASPSYEVGRRSTGAGEDTSERDLGAVDGYNAVASVLDRCGPRAARLAERLCVDGQHLMAEELREACEALDALVEHFGGRRRRAASGTRENSATIRENRQSNES